MIERAHAPSVRPVPASDFSNLSIDETMRLADMFAKSGFFQDSRELAQCVTKMIAGAELGFGAVASMVGVYIVKGKVSLSANLIGAAIKRSGRYNYRVRTLTDQACALEFFEGGESIGVSDFSIEDAKNAGLLANQTWKQYPRNMLFARAMSNGARWYTPDIFGGPIYTPEELGAPVDDEGDLDRTPAIRALDPPSRGPAIAAALDAEVAAVDAAFGEPLEAATPRGAIEDAERVEVAERRRLATAMNPPNQAAVTQATTWRAGDLQAEVSALVDELDAANERRRERGEHPVRYVRPLADATDDEIRQWILARRRSLRAMGPAR